MEQCHKPSVTKQLPRNMEPCQKTLVYENGARTQNTCLGEQSNAQNNCVGEESNVAKHLSSRREQIHGYFSSRVISNVALNKPTTQSSTLTASSLAVDGFVDPPTCMSTSGTGYQWWQVDLGAVYTILNVSIQINIDELGGLRNTTLEFSKTNTSDVRGHLLDASLCYNVVRTPAPVDNSIIVPCQHDTIGRYLRISKIIETQKDALTFCEVVVEVSRNKCNLADIALNKPATQSSVRSEGVAGRAVDGNLNPHYSGCTHTHDTDNNPWWQVDLGGVYSIDHVSVQNRLFRGYRLKDFIVEISESEADGPDGHRRNSKLCYNYTEDHVPSAELRTLACPTDTVGRYLRITKSSSLLTLCEVIVEVYGYFSSRVISNVALNKPTTQSSTIGDSSLAVDGFVDPPTCMSTSGTGFQWWQVDLGSVYTITNISIQINIDEPGGLRNVTVELSQTNTSDMSGHLLGASLCYNLVEPQAPGDRIITLPCPHDTIGRYLRMSRLVENPDDALTFCEVVVEVSRDECNLADIALNKPTTQSSLRAGGVAGQAVDGNLNPAYDASSCTHTDASDNKPWWQVDLGDVYSINHVSIQNRLHHGDRLKEFIVEISEINAIAPDGHFKNSKLCYNYTEAHVPDAELRTLSCPTDTVGRYLRITKSFSRLTLCEVIVEGKPVSCLDVSCPKIPTIRQHDNQSLKEIVMALKKLMSGTGSRCNFRRKWIDGGCVNGDTIDDKTPQARKHCIATATIDTLPP
ncbi:uncharacterized protein LOC117332978 [Pecten maximus]|uniref:uncharacterized protein LOC117332978 n=1 Tax=Pecten maximus TaxID=6579 RepID=UPI0014584A3F|nr:uncharacterized protein LOC117332978 [Pecten maximus]